MKTKFNKLISLLLVIAFLVSALTVFAWAADGDGETEAVEVDVLYNRNYEEGWDALNGFTPSLGSHTATIDFEESSDYKYNYFTRFTHGLSGSGGLQFAFGVDTIVSGQTIVELDIKADDVCAVGKIMYMQTSASKSIDLAYISGNSLTIGGKTVAALTDDWTTVTMLFNWDSEDFNLTVFSDWLDEPVVITQAYAQANDSGMKNLYIGLYEGAASKKGMSYCIDNLKIYQGEGLTGPVDISDKGCGEKVDPLAEKVVDIKESAGGKSVEDLLKEALCLKVGVPYALIRDKKTSIDKYCTPTVIDGKVMVPLLLILDFIGYPYYVHPDGESYDITTGTSVTYLSAGRDSINVDGEQVPLSVVPGYVKNALDEQVLVIAIDDVPSIFPGWLLTYDDMGLIIMYEGEISEDEEEDEEEGESSGLITREKDLDTMLTMMKRFVFDTVTTDNNGEALELSDSYTATGTAVYGDVKENTNNFTHPYIYANQETFDKFAAIYTAQSDAENYNETLKGYIAEMVSKADEIYKDVAEVGKNGYVGIAEGKAPVNVYADGKNPDGKDKNDKTVADSTNGYNTETNALYEIEEYTENLVTLAFAYQMTRDNKYAKLAYDYSKTLGEWSHWGPGYMPNCATATSNFAVAYDWLYNAYVALELDVSIIESILFTQGVKHGYNSSIGIACTAPRASGEGDLYTTLGNTNNIVCSSGMITGALALMGNDTYKEENVYVVGNNIINLINYGLDQYAPDGSYIESARHWEMGTNSFMKLIMALNSAAGNDYGFAGTWGLNNTFYYALYIENSDGEIWNYHDGGADGVTSGEILGINTMMFNYAATLLGDERLFAFREMQLAKGKELSIFDIFYYPTEPIEADTTLELDYVMSGIDAFVSRSDWENGALYVGLMGGLNDCAYGQIDSGNFIYQNEGITWIMDLGSDDPNVYSYNGQYRYYHYRNNAEGQNVPIITSAKDSLPYGQDRAGAGKIVASYSNEYGSYAILDNASAYGSVVSLANRGILVTNDRKTVVVQDEISFSIEEGVGTVYWVAHTAQEITISEDQRTAYLSSFGDDGKIYILRASLVARMQDIKFTVQEEAPSGLLDITYNKNDSFNKGGAYEYSREPIKKLILRADSVPQFNVAVVFEMVDSTSSVQPVGYEWSAMNTWMPSSSDASSGDEETAKRGTAVKSDILTETNAVSSFYRYEVAYTEEFASFYKSLTAVAYILKSFPPETLDNRLANSYSDYLDYYDDYNEYMEDINERVEATGALANKLAGLG